MSYKSLTEHAKRDAAVATAGEYNRPSTPNNYSDMLKPFYKKRKEWVRSSL